MFRRRRRNEPEAPVDPLAAIDPVRVPARFAPVVRESVAARDRWVTLLAGLRPGPIRDRLGEIGVRIDQGVIEVWETACRAGEIERTLAALDPDEATAAYKRAKRSADDGHEPPELPALEARFSSVQRLLNLLDDTEARLRLLDARLDAAIARGAEVAVTASTDEADRLGDDLDAVVDELTALRAGLDAID